MSTNPLSNQNYINKDFQSIYPELLELVKQLSYRWDPTISNESDPGVVLIKLNAILADKNNYAIDKNMLECFPDTVTQDSNAYQLFNQLGYKMGGYVSATGEASFLWNSDTVKDSNGSIYKVPLKKFTMLSDKDKSIVYTLLEDVSLDMDKYGAEVRGKVIQGVVRDYTVYGDKVIRIDAIDNRNRLYFPLRNVAENGIFIGTWQPNSNNELEFIYSDDAESTVTQVQDPRHWKLVDNLQSQPMGTKCYAVGLDNITNSFYVEFPSDYTDLFGDGISIKYLQTDGYQGNIRPGVLRTFYNDYEIFVPGENGESEALNITKMVDITNVNSLLDGKDPETIDTAYANYKRTVGTFDTLVTLRDYLNYIVNPDFGVASNGVISDRTTDIQSSYKIMKRKEWQDSDLNHFANVLDTKVLKDENGKEHMSAFDLKTYLLSFSPVESVAKFSTPDVSEIRRAYEKSFTLELNTADGWDKLETQQKVLDLIDGAKSVQHNFISKLTSEYYEDPDGNEIEKIYPLFIKNKVNLTMSIVPTSYVTSAQAEEIEKNVYTALYTKLSADKLKFGEELLYETIYDICNAADSRVKAVALDPLEFTPYAVVYIKYKDSLTEGELREIELPTTVVDNSAYPYTTKTLNPHSLDEYVDEDRDVAEIIATDILAKSVLSGSTALYVPSVGFKYDLLMTNAHLYKEVKSVSTHMELEFASDSDMLHSGSGMEITLGENESITLYAPELTGGVSYGAGTKYLYYTRDTYTGTNPLIPSNVDYELQSGQVLFLFLKEEDSSTAPYKYYKYTKGAIINSSIQLVDEKRTKTPLIQKLESLGLGVEGQIVGSTNDAISDIMDTILSTTKTIVVKEINDVELKSATKYFSWITSEYGKDASNNIDYDSSKITFNRRKESGPLVERSYSGGYLYLANFDDYKVKNDGTGALEQYKLTQGQEVMIIEPIESTVKYNVWDEYTNTMKINSAQVTNYRRVTTLMEGDSIRSTGTLYNCNDIELFPVGYSSVLDQEGTWTNLYSESNRRISLERELIGSSSRLKLTAHGMSVLYKEVPVSPSTTYRLKIGASYGHFDPLLTSPGTDGIALYTSYSVGLYKSASGWDPEDTSVTIDSSVGEYEVFYTTASNQTKLYIRIDFLSGTGTNEILYLDELSITPAVREGTFWSVVTNTFDNNDYLAYGGLLTSKGGENQSDSLRLNSVAQLLDKYRNVITLSNGFRIDVLSSNSDTPTTVYYDYIVKNNENFFYANSNRDAIEVLGTGSRVTLKLQYPDGTPKKEIKDSISSTIKRIPLTEKVLPKDNSFWKDKSAFASNLPSIDGTPTVVSYFVNSSSLITLGEGTIIKVRRLGEEVQAGQPVITGQTNSTIVSYVVEDPLYKSLKITSEGIYTSDESVTSEGQAIHWSELDPTALSHFTIQYRNADEDSSSFVELPRAQQSSIAWNGWATLNIKALTDTPQALDYDHKHRFDITYLLPRAENSLVYDSRTATLESEYGGVNQDPIIKYLKFSPGLDLMGGTNVLLAAVGSDNQISYPSLLAYNRRTLDGNQDTTNHNKCSLVVCKDSLGGIIRECTSHMIDSSGKNFVRVNLKPDTPNSLRSIEFHLSNISEDTLSGTLSSNLSVIVPFRFVYNAAADNLSLRAPTLGTFDGQVVNVGNVWKSYVLGVSDGESPTKPLVKANTYYYLKVSLSEDKCVYIPDVQASDFSIPDYLYIYEPYFIDYNLSDLVAENKLLSKISSLDVDNEFDYAYSPEKSVALDNPLLGRRYFRSNHIFNKFTIAQLNNINLTTMNKR